MATLVKIRHLIADGLTPPAQCCSPVKSWPRRGPGRRRLVAGVALTPGPSWGCASPARAPGPRSPPCPSIWPELLRAGLHRPETALPDFAALPLTLPSMKLQELVARSSTNYLCSGPSPRLSSPDILSSHHASKLMLA